MRFRVGAAILCVLASAAAPRAVQLTLDHRAIDEAIAIGQSRLTGERSRFHDRYRIHVAMPPVDYIDVITPFRRVVIAAQRHAQRGDRGFGQREAQALLADTPDTIDLYVELTFHPLNTYIGVPDYRVVLAPVANPARVVDPRATERVPRFGARLDDSRLPYPIPIGPPLLTGSQPLLGGTLVAHFDGRQLRPRGTYVALITETGGRGEPVKEIARARINLGALR